MQLRKKTKVDYKNLIRPDFYFKISYTKNNRNYLLKHNSVFDEEIEHLKGIVVKVLISSTSKTPVVRKSIEIPKKFAYFLIKNYSLTNRWTICNNFLEVFNFETERHFNEFDYCGIKKDSFKLRITSPQIKYKDNTLKDTTRKLKQKLHLSLTVSSLKKK